jgi:hypothetical protein
MLSWLVWTWRGWASNGQIPPIRDGLGTIRDLLKLYLYGYLQQVRSSRRLENECRRNVEVMWLLHRLAPDHKSIAEFQRTHSEAVTQAGEELIRFARSLGLVRGDWVAVDGSKFRAVSSVGSVREREAVKRYLESLESADQEEELVVEPSKTAEALKKLQEHKEPEAHFMRATTGAKVPAYNVQCRCRHDCSLNIAFGQASSDVCAYRDFSSMGRMWAQLIDFTDFTRNGLYQECLTKLLRHK